MSPPYPGQSGLIIAATHSGAGKTSLTTGLIFALCRKGLRIQPFKCGPDYIDPGFLGAAAGRPCFNLDGFAMGTAEMAGILALAGSHDLAIAEGVMGLFDAGPAPGRTGAGSTADIAAATGWPVILVIDAAKMAQTAGAIALGCATFRPDVLVAGVILNRVASERHRELAETGLDQAGIPLLGSLPARKEGHLPSRHLGLVQSGEMSNLASIIEGLAEHVAAGIDLEALIRLARPARLTGQHPLRMAPPGGRIALARDAAFSFIYPHMIAGWRASGATILPFSPLADEPPDESADIVWLPGGYPELHAPRLTDAGRFRSGMQAFARRKPVHGECGGYMTLGAGITTRDGARHAMLGLLGLETSFLPKRMRLGYRRATLLEAMPGLAAGTRLIGHEFHYAGITHQPDAPLAVIRDPTGAVMPETGSRRGHVTGSFFHLIARDA
ncbi:MAG: cobyrinate a,c-diamide synthase [Hyphomicrobiales bacterium]|uniref:cobyrinate a,c-diamide synthase n=1 Tax=Rhabdaerophilum calidifontis TaxID=2604328 RepID=UPI00123A6A48|nr:cobyrinate a,c-diamide synthase [Rhabdaerophilum calidifontis]MCA1951515.1 cobyrinate a,c-diamide synthase [Hyphomicrobiales bacterium]MCA1998283.1 cobyrinate a,c-diamide synthase [Hyphomicrobiales bacterium]